MVGGRGFGVVVRGNSMNNWRIDDGNIVWINPDQPIRYGVPVLARIVNGDGDQGMVVKVYTRIGDRDCLMSDNSEYGTTPVVCDEFKVIGPVVWVEEGHAPQRIRGMRSA